MSGGTRKIALRIAVGASRAAVFRMIRRQRYPVVVDGVVVAIDLGQGRRIKWVSMRFPFRKTAAARVAGSIGLASVGASTHGRGAAIASHGVITNTKSR